MKYRPEIDGLRALSVIPVILFHSGFELFSGGFIGVDVFFVISGYLITTIIIEDLEQNRFSVVDFYKRRARRILPSLFVVLLFCSLFAWMVMPDAALQKFGSALIGVSFFLSNVVFVRQQGYFDEAAEFNPLLHTWSLAVEEQYYLVFPIFLILTWRFGKNNVFWMIVVMAGVSFLLSEWGWRNKPIANFYLAPTRAWELFAGSMAAFIVHRHGAFKNNLLALLGLATIILSILIYDETTPFPSAYALAPVLGAVLLILYAHKETFVAKFLSTRELVGIGLISYSAYLWHQPLFAFSRIYQKKIFLGITFSLILVLLTFLLAYISWRFIETPFRKSKSHGIFNLSLISLVSLPFIFILGYFSNQVSVDGEYRLARLLSENDYVYFENLDERKFMAARLYYPLSPTNSIVVGSSRVMQINSTILGENIQNFSVSGASVEDIIAFGLEALAKLQYQNIYISADPWILNLNNQQNRYRSIDDLFQYWLTRMYSSLIPVSYFRNNSTNMNGLYNVNYLQELRRNFSLGNQNVIPTHGDSEAVDKKAYDGSHIYNVRALDENITEARDEILNYAMLEFAYDAEAISNLEALVDYLKENSVRVTLVLSPYHPAVYQFMADQKPIFLELESWYRDFAEENDIQIIGSYDAHLVGCTENEFYDGMHPTASCISRLFMDNSE